MNKKITILAAAVVIIGGIALWQMNIQVEPVAPITQEEAMPDQPTVDDTSSEDIKTQEETDEQSADETKFTFLTSFTDPLDSSSSTLNRDRFYAHIIKDGLDYTSDFALNYGTVDDLKIILGDLTSDGKDEAIVKIPSGGTAGDIALLVYRIAEGKPNEFVLMDVIEGYKILAEIKNGQLITTNPHYAAGDPNCCPTFSDIETYTWNGEQFIVMDKQRVKTSELNDTSPISEDTFTLCDDAFSNIKAKDLGNRYYADNESVYFFMIPGGCLEKIQGSDPDSFEALSSIFAKDTNNVYETHKVLVDADPATFRVIQGTDGSLCPFGEDKNGKHFHWFVLHGDGTIATEELEQSCIDVL